MAQEINLLENRIHDTSQVWQNQNKLIMTVLAVILIIVLGLGTVLFLLSQSIVKQTDQVVADNKTIQDKMSSQQADLADATTLQAQLANLHTLINGHVYFSPFLAELSKMTFQKAQYLNLDATPDGKIHIEGRIDNYTNLGKLVLGLSTSSKFSNVKLLSAVPSTGVNSGYLFSLNLNASSDLFSKK